MATVIDQQTFEEIVESQSALDMSAPLTDEELEHFGMVVGKTPTPKEENSTPVLKDLDDVEEAPASEDAVAVYADGKSYNTQYVQYLQCQALASLIAFEEGWKAFENLVVKPYLVMRKRENDGYRGDDPNKAFSLRVKKQESEDFVKFMRAKIAEAINTPKPVLGGKKGTASRRIA